MPVTGAAKNSRQTWSVFVAKTTLNIVDNVKKLLKCVPADVNFPFEEQFYFTIGK